MTHPLFGKEIFVETAFERRFQAMLRSALHKQSWHVIVADPGAGKTMGIRDLIRTTGSLSILAVTAPKNNDQDSGVPLVECPDCARTRSLTPHKGVLRFPSHDQRKIQTPNTVPRWVRGQTGWDPVGAERPTELSTG